MSRVATADDFVTFDNNDLGTGAGEKPTSKIAVEIEESSFLYFDWIQTFSTPLTNINVTGVIRSSDIGSDKTMGKWWTNMQAKHYALFAFFLSWSVIAVYDLLLLAFTGVTVLHWANDVLLIFGSISMCITVIMTLMHGSE